MQPETTYAFPGVNSYLIYTQDATDEELNVANQVRSQELQDLHDSLTVCPFSAKDLEVVIIIRLFCYRNLIGNIIRVGLGS